VIAAAGRLGEPARAVRAGPEALEKAEAAFLTNSLIGLRAISAVDGRKLASSPLVAALAAAID
jgi:branched-chain amino acid aminotransferase/4-amino-4-deoxychorismate lyase